MFTVTEVGVCIRSHKRRREVTPVLMGANRAIHFPAAEATLLYSRNQNKPQLVKHSSFDTFQVAPCAMTL